MKNSYNKSDEIRAVLIQTGDERVLLPNATLAETLARVPVEYITGTPPWLLGQIAWHGWKVPLLSYARFNGHDEPLNDNNKVVVLKALGNNHERPYLALLTQNFPHLLTVSRDGLLVDASEGNLPPGVRMRVLLDEQVVLLPDLDVLETATIAALTAVDEA